MNTQTDIIVLGATGFTGRLITRYLAAHPQFKQGLFSFAIAARSQSKLHTLVQQLSLPPTIHTIRVDVTDYVDLEKVVRSTKIVINAIGPYWRWGSPVVRCVADIPHNVVIILITVTVLRACASNGIHHLDLTGETYWIHDIIEKCFYQCSSLLPILVITLALDMTTLPRNQVLSLFHPVDLNLFHPTSPLS
jgi:short subunit dehydrogenase-like uncharacterized protein